MNNQPLATRMRPRSLSDVVGQPHLIGPGQILTRMVDTKRVTSIVLYGPPGIGKTSIAHALSNDLGVPFAYFNAGVHTKKELQDIAKHATPDAPIVALIDEVHRLDKPKQDFLLMQLEEGSLIMVGATTENPYISMNPALRSRGRIFELKSVTPQAVADRLRTALLDREYGLGETPAVVDYTDLLFIAEMTHGDLRSALNALELAVLSTELVDGETVRQVTRDVIHTCLQTNDIGGDKDGDSHYNLLSAFQKSIRGSDVDAALHYLARLIHAGDIISINRRLLVIAFEDIGLAQPGITTETLTAVTTAEKVGLPEARIPLAHIVVRLALSPKSNVAYKALDIALEALNDGRVLEIPKHLKDAHYKGAVKLGNGVDYKYPHAYPYNITQQSYLPDDYAGDRYLQFRDEYDLPTVQNEYGKINQFIKS